MNTDYILEMEGITKKFPGVVALNGVDLRVKKGTVHALLGENGAGKSTLMKVLNGIYSPDAGMITFKGRKVQIIDTHSAITLGISMIHQELNPIPNMTVAENIYLGRYPLKRALLIDKKQMVDQANQLFEKLNLKINPRLKMKELSIANTQIVEIAKAISYNSDLIIMDEPTSAITEKEVEHLFRIINMLRAEGVSIIYITHKMGEVFRITDYITVLRDGCHIATEKAADLTREQLISMMVGRELNQIFDKERVEIGEVVLAVRNLTKKGKFADVSFQLHKGEILGIAGLMGAGRTEVMECVFGVNRPDSGEIYINGKKVTIKSPVDSIKHKIAFLTEDRKLTGLFLSLPVRDNIIIAAIDQFRQWFWLKKKAILQVCEENRRILDIRTPSIFQITKFLSGGNQQKLLIARWLLTEPDILILDEPTRGIDVGAKAEIHKLMSRLAREGKAILMISSEMAEILGMSDRIIVMHEGKVAGGFASNEVTQEKILACATGN